VIATGTLCVDEGLGVWGLCSAIDHAYRPDSTKPSGQYCIATNRGREGEPLPAQYICGFALRDYEIEENKEPFLLPE